MRFGAHVTIAGGLLNAIKKAQEIGAECIQIFSSSPRGWQGPKHQRGSIKEFSRQAAKNNLYPIFVHAKYLVNLASPNNEVLEKSKKSLINELNFSVKIKASGVIFHVGSHKGKGQKFGFNQIVNSCKEVLATTPKKSFLVFENSAGMKNTIGSSIIQLAKLIKTIGSNRIKVCLDSAHLFASGYKIHTEKGLEKFLKEFDKKIGLKRLVCLHFNDSKMPFASGRDRHENIGKGEINLNGFKVLIANKNLQKFPAIIETPGFTDEGPDKKNLNILKSFTLR